jgi:Fe-S cluster assembly iron-binding protein IscA
MTVETVTLSDSAAKRIAVILKSDAEKKAMRVSEIDFVDNLLGQSFQIKNPNAVASCGCGTSFSV